MVRPVRLLLALLAWLSGVPPAHATHIVGGELSYTCLGGNQYQIRLTIFRDCYNGDPQAWFDDPASIGIFNAQNELVDEILIPWDEMRNDTLDPVLSDECFVAPPDVCVHTTTYTTTVVLPPVAGGYVLAYQRCCRNGTISNIVDPLAVGATYTVTISEKALLECNSSPQFNAWPPLYICVNEPIWFDQSAVDADGDSLVYRLCTPLAGASQADPMPQPPAPPPYEPVPWLDPPYNEDNMLNGLPGGEPLAIDPHTGLLTGLPNTIGQFVVGICVEEYRDGQLIGTTRRDFQYNVGECGQATAAFFAPEVVCGALEVAFDNQSLFADQFAWIVSQGGTVLGTSTEAEPVWSFPDTGWYEVTLIAASGMACADTFSRSIHLLPQSLFPNFTFSFAECSDSMVVQIHDLTFDTLFAPAAWLWLLGSDTLSTVQEPELVFRESGNWWLTLQVTNTEGCTEQVTQLIPVDLIEFELASDSLSVCAGSAVALNPAYDPLLHYVWSPGASIDDSLSANPVATPDTSTLYTVTITDNGALCAIERQVWVEVRPLPALDVPDTLATCNDTVWLSAVLAEGVPEWSATGDFQDVIAADSILVAATGDPRWYVRATDANGCQAFDSVQVHFAGIEAAWQAPQVVCPGDTAVAALWPADTAGVSVTFTGAGWSSGGPFTAWLTTPDAGWHGLSANAANAAGCTWTDTIAVFVADTTDQAPLADWQPCSGTTVAFTLDGPNAAIAWWLFGDPDAPGAGASGSPVSWDYGAPGAYLALLTFGDSLACLEPVPVLVQLDEPGVWPAIDASLVACDSLATGLFVNATWTGQHIEQLVWLSPNDTLQQSDSLLVHWTEPDTLTVGLVVLTAEGCRDTAWTTLVADPIAPPLPDSVGVCAFPAALGLDLPQGYAWMWMPADQVVNPAAADPVVLAPGRYTAAIQSLAVPQCRIADTVAAHLLPAVQVQLPPDTSVCGGAVALEAMTNVPASVAWYVWPDTLTPAATGPAWTFDPDSTTTLVAVATAEGYCPGRDTVQVSDEALHLTWHDQYLMCPGDTIVIGVNNSDTGAWSIHWQPELFILSEPDAPMIVVSPDEPMLYQFMAENAAGCTASGFVDVQVAPPPQAQLTFFPSTVYAGEEVLVTLDMTSLQSVEWQTVPPVPLTDAGPGQVRATLDSTTTFTAVATDFRGCTGTWSVTVPVIGDCAEPFVFVPNAFTPNGDGLNDEFRVFGPVVEVVLVVYDRWGEEVFRSEDPNTGWDGTWKGKRLPPDVYAWQAWVRCPGGRTATLKGNVTLLW